MRTQLKNGLIKLICILQKFKQLYGYYLKKGLESICLAKKAGDFVTGFEKVGEKIRHGKAAFLLEAADAGADGHQKITALANGLEIFALYSVEELDKALDRVNTVHATLLKGDMAKLVHTDLVRLQRFLNS